MDSVRELLGMQDEEEQEQMEEMGLEELVGNDTEEPECFQKIEEKLALSYKTRIYGFAITVAIGFACSFLSIVFLFSVGFAILYTLSNIAYLCSTFFMAGPMRQLRGMFKPHRAIASLIYIVAMAITLYAALGLHSYILAMLMAFIQMLALIWYITSYIPYAHDAMKRCFEGVMEV